MISCSQNRDELLTKDKWIIHSRTTISDDTTKIKFYKKGDKKLLLDFTKDSIISYHIENNKSVINLNKKAELMFFKELKKFDINHHSWYWRTNKKECFEVSGLKDNTYGGMLNNHFNIVELTDEKLSYSIIEICPIFDDNFNITYDTIKRIKTFLHPDNEYW